MRNADCHSKNIALLYTSRENVRLAPVYDMLTTCVYADYKDRPPGIPFMGKKTWQPGKSLGKFLASQFGIPPREQAALVEQISDAVSDTAPLVREAMGGHPGFREMGKHLLRAWSEVVISLRDKHAYALGGWTPGDAFQGFSAPPPLKARKRIIGKS